MSICEGNSFEGHSASGTYIKLAGQTTFGCDSLRILHLEVGKTKNHALSQTICEGEVFEGHRKAGTYRDTFKIDNSCDSIRVLQLQILKKDTVRVTAAICPTETFEQYRFPGQYTDVFKNRQGCDSVRFLTLTHVPPRYSRIAASFCKKGSIEGYNKAGVYTDTLKSLVTGCDSIRTIAIRFENVYQEEEIWAALCGQEAYEAYTESGIYRDTFQRENECDSIRILHLKNLSLYIPNVFSPNDDGRNDHFVIFANDADLIKPEEVSIYDRWGSSVYHSKTVSLSTKLWDGTAQNRPAPEGVYVYFFKFKCQGSLKILKGDITLIR
jgi:gliding motility-associated-like protein